MASINTLREVPVIVPSVSPRWQIGEINEVTALSAEDYWMRILWIVMNGVA
jgi:hypothetical protein